MKIVLLQRNMHNNLGNENHLQLPNTKTTAYGMEIIQYRGHLLRSQLLMKLKTPSNTQSEFKRQKKYEMEIYTYICRLCKVFIKDLRFVGFKAEIVNQVFTYSVGLISYIMIFLILQT